MLFLKSPRGNFVYSKESSSQWSAMEVHSFIAADSLRIQTLEETKQQIPSVTSRIGRLVRLRYSRRAGRESCGREFFSGSRAGPPRRTWSRHSSEQKIVGKQYFSNFAGLIFLYLQTEGEKSLLNFYPYIRLCSKQTHSCF